MSGKKIVMCFGLSVAAIVGAASAVPYLSSPVCAAGLTACNEKAAGHGTLNRGDGKRQFSFNAMKQADGTAKGNAILQSSSRDFRGNIDVTCLEVNGNRARIGGVIKNTNDPASDNSTVIFEVVDNGEPGKGSDTISGVFFSPPNSPPPTPEYCRASFETETLPPMTIDGGNIQVTDCP